ARIRNRRAAERAATAAEASTSHSVPLPPSRTCSGCSKRRPVTDFSLKNPLGDADGERYLVCAPCTAKRNLRRPPKRNIEQVGQQDDEPPPARRQRLSAVPTQAAEAAEAAGTEETPAIDRSTPCPGPCPGCMRWLPLSAFPRGSDGARARQCVRCNATQANRRPRQDPEQTAPLDEQDADGHDDGPPPASPRQETPAVDSVPTQLCSGCHMTRPLCDFTKNNKVLRTCVQCRVRQRNRRPPRPQTPLPHIQDNVAGQENVAPQSVRRPRQSSASANADRAASERRRTAAVEEALAAALRTAEATTRQGRGADAARAAEAEVVAARRALTASQDAMRAVRASQEARRAAVLAAAAEEARR
ncbi:hypothetical protein E4U34_008394, partial [Claviceps purpurea]